MSWEATAWAKKTRGHGSHACGRLLLVLAECHHPEDNIAWPSQKYLADNCEMPERTVRWCLARLEANGFITRMRKGNQYQRTEYRLNFDVTAAQSCEPAINEPAKVAAASEPAISDKVNRQGRASEPATLVTTNLQRTDSKGPTVAPTFSSAIAPENVGGHSPSKNGKLFETQESPLEVWPAWFALLRGVEAFKTEYAAAELWRVQNRITEDMAELKAYAVRDWWPRQPKSRTKAGSVYMTWQNWCRRDRDQPVALKRSTYGRPEIIADYKQFPEKF